MAAAEHIIQNVVFPGLTFGAPEDMYVRKFAGAFTRLSQRSLQFRPRGYAAFDTFFNALSLRIWRQKTSLDNVALRLCGHGRFIVRVGVHRPGNEPAWIIEKELRLDDDDQSVVDLENWESLQRGLLFFSLEALSEGEVTGGYYFTTMQPCRAVRLGLVITHFNREHAVVPALERLRRELIHDEIYKGKVEVIVVDNSKSLTTDDTQDMTHLLNENLGGAGGFTRGLLHLLDQKMTHCLFMDDDASCEIEAIKRGYAVLSYSKSPDLAIAGSQLREERPWQVWEAGGSFTNGHIYPLYHDLDVRQPRDLMILEQQPEHPDYGAWWYFAFPIDKIESFPFPFFVRGDDILFSLANRFDITTVNGISVWGEDFAEKENAFTRYLALRSVMVLMLLKSTADFRRFWRLCLSSVAANLFSFNYGSAAALILAIRHVLRGPEFWTNNIDMAAVRSKLAPMVARERAHPVSVSFRNFEHPRHSETKLRRYVRILTINGMLLPRCMRKARPLTLTKAAPFDLKSAFRHNKILFVSERSGTGYMAECNAKLAAKIAMEFLFAMLLLRLRLGAIRKVYRDEAPRLTSLSFWREVYPDSRGPSAT